MAKTVNITIDGVQFKAPEGMNLIDAAELAGIHIPNLCYLKGMKGVGACRLCMVEVEGSRGPVIACNTRVKDGMVVRTSTDEIQESRKFVVDLVLSMHPLDCMTCTKAGVCNLQRYAYEFDIKESSFTRKRFGYPVDVSNPFIKMSPDYCVLCGRCVRVCKEQGTNVLEFMGRGVGAKVTTVVDRALEESDCTFCGSCVDACPVNAIMEADRWRKGREWEYEKTNSVCLLCGNACDITVSTRDGSIQKINAGADKGSVRKYICAYGRFGFDYLGSDNRLLTPMKRVEGKLVETTWQDALKTVAEKLTGAGGETGFISVASIENEDALTLRRLAGEAVGTKNIDTTMSLYADADILKDSQRAVLADADTIVVVGVDPSQRERVLPALNVAIRKKVARGGKLILVNSGEAKLDKVASVSLKGDEVQSLRSLAKAALAKGLKGEGELAGMVQDAPVTEEAEQAAEILAQSEKPLILASPALFHAASNLALLKGRSLAFTFESNAKGVALMGLTTEGRTYREMVAGGMKALYAVGEAPLSVRPEGTEFLVVQNSHITELAKQADVLLPSATYLESAGTIVDFKGRLRHIPRLIEPMGKAMSHREIFSRLAKAMGKPIKKGTEEEARALARTEGSRRVRPFARREELNVSPEMILQSVSISLLNSQRLLWLKETEKVAAR
jgi:NADH dehydrogenase/NADH:ubiquinone oxidoreductase subunit G